jgi:hypothetical protein
VKRDGDGDGVSSRRRQFLTELGTLGMTGVAGCGSWSAEDESELVASASDFTTWERPADQPVFTVDHNTNHDAVFFVEPETAYPYKMIVCHRDREDLWRTTEFHWSASHWELVDDAYRVAGTYELDDGVKVDGTYYLFEGGKVYTYSGNLADAGGNWERAGSWPNGDCEDIGVYHENGRFHIFGERGSVPFTPDDGRTLSHYTSRSGLGDWTEVDTAAVNPNEEGGRTYGVGDATIAKVDSEYYLYCDLETRNRPYEIACFRSDRLDGRFEYAGTAIKPRRDETDDWDNYRIQDGDIQYVPDLNRYVMAINMMDTDGDPGKSAGERGFDLPRKQTRVIGFVYSQPME